MAIRIITDSGSDYETREIESRGGAVVPMTLTYGTDSFLSGVEISTEEFYHRLLEEKEIPVTSQPSPEQFLQEFKAAKEAGDSVVAVLLSSALSGTFQSALLAKQLVEYDEIYLVDSLSATAGMKILIETAYRMIGEGKSAKEIAAHLETLKSKIKILAVIDTLEYLYKGGRLTKTQAGLGTLANLKPVITISREGKVTVQAKAIGRKRACRLLLDQIEQTEINKDYPAYFVYSAERQNCMNFKSELETRMLLENCQEIMELGPTIGTHVGGGVFGIVFIEE